MFGIGTGELLLLLLIALIVLGPERMPQVARDVGKAMNELRKTSDELQQELLNADRPAPPPPPAEPPALPDGASKAIEATERAAAETPSTAEPQETEFDREARLARERLDAAASDKTR